MTFTEYCKQNNIQLLRDDIKFLRSILCTVPKGRQKAVARQYVAIWCECMPESQNAARHAANTYLRGIVDAKLDTQTQRHAKS